MSTVGVINNATSAAGNEGYTMLGVSGYMADGVHLIHIYDETYGPNQITTIEGSPLDYNYIPEVGKGFIPAVYVAPVVVIPIVPIVVVPPPVDPVIPVTPTPEPWQGGLLCLALVGMIIFRGRYGKWRT